MTLALVTGDLGKGKSLYESYIGAKHSNETEIYPNFTLKVPNVTPLTLQNFDEIREGLILIDEAYEWLECRISGEEVSRFITKIIFKSRKRGIDIMCGAQLESTLDLRFRNLNHIRIEALGLIKDKGYLYLINRKRLKLLKWNIAIKLFDIYDTMEEPEIIRPTVFDTKIIAPKISEIANKILKKYGNLKLTRGLIEDIFISEGYDMTYLDWTFQRLRRLQMVKE